MTNDFQSHSILSVEHIVKRYGGKLAVNKVSLHVNEGETVLLLGQNGAGKTTTIKSILNLERFDEGKVLVNGNSINTKESKQIIGYVPEVPVPYDNLTVWQHVQFIMRAYSLKNHVSKAIELLKEFDLDRDHNTLGKNLSKGMKQKLSICCALLPNPKLIIFDEPFVGLDQLAITNLKKKIKSLKNLGCGILIITHMIEMVEAMWDRAYIMDKGSIISEQNIKTFGDSSGLSGFYFDLVSYS
ncbi:MAG: ABC transporter ATP-binding protein [Amphibacillus sp.]|nr:ABC transporter ATP-binding protein [Amphibacillus sp.]